MAHGNSLRGLVKHLTGMSDDEIMNFELKTAVPLVLEFDSQFKAHNYYSLLHKI